MTLYLQICFGAVLAITALFIASVLIYAFFMLYTIPYKWAKYGGAGDFELGVIALLLILGLPTIYLTYAIAWIYTTIRYARIFG